MIVVSGPNQGGKTTFARAFGQLHYLASLGCPVPGTRAQLFLFDSSSRISRGKKTSRISAASSRTISSGFTKSSKRATPNSIVIMNEIFTSTTLRTLSS